MDRVLEHCGLFNLLANNEADLPTCTRTFTTTLGLPCAHIVQDRLLQKSSLRPEDFHPQWYLDNPAERPPINPILLLRDPVKVRAHGKDNGRKERRERI